MSREASIEEFAAAHRAGALVLDVREPAEYLGGHVPGARLFPLRSIAAKLDELPRNERIYVICASGNRSAMAVSLLRQAGYDARSVAGGTSAWTGQGRPVVHGPRENAA